LGDISTKLGAFFHKTSGHTAQLVAAGIDKKKRLADLVSISLDDNEKERFAFESFSSRREKNSVSSNLFTTE
jgi:hypothetical protein